jgi:hypothetical protein
MIDAISRSLNIPCFGDLRAVEEAARDGNDAAEHDPDHEALNNLLSESCTKEAVGLGSKRKIIKGLGDVLRRSRHKVSEI